jgi:hypothetical protein
MISIEGIYFFVRWRKGRHSYFTLTKNTHVKTHMWNTCGSHVELEQSHVIHIWFTCEPHVFHMWVFTCVFFVRVIGLFVLVEYYIVMVKYGCWPYHFMHNYINVSRSFVFFLPGSKNDPQGMHLRWIIGCGPTRYFLCEHILQWFIAAL